MPPQQTSNCFGANNGNTCYFSGASDFLIQGANFGDVGSLTVETNFSGFQSGMTRATTPENLQKVQSTNDGGKQMTTRYAGAGPHYFTDASRFHISGVNFGTVRGDFECTIDGSGTVRALANNDPTDSAQP